MQHAAASAGCGTLKYLPADLIRDSLPSYGMQRLLQHLLLGARPRRLAEHFVMSMVVLRVLRCPMAKRQLSRFWLKGTNSSPAIAAGIIFRCLSACPQAEHGDTGACKNDCSLGICVGSKTI